MLYQENCFDFMMKTGLLWLISPFQFFSFSSLLCPFISLVLLGIALSFYRRTNAGGRHPPTAPKPEQKRTFQPQGYSQGGSHIKGTAKVVTTSAEAERACADQKEPAIPIQARLSIQRSVAMPLLLSHIHFSSVAFKWIIM